MSPPLLHVEDVCKSFPGASIAHSVLTDATLALDAGETVALTGESGSGKSTLLTLIAGLDAPDSGRILLAGRALSDMSETELANLRRTRVGLVFQQFNLIPSLTAYQNLGFQARLANRFDAKAVARIAERLGLSDHLDRYPEQLSGGQQQRIAIGRALAAGPELLLADEPTGNLDEATSENVLNLMLELVSDTGAALLMVTHSTHLAGQLSRRIHLTNGHLV